MSTTTISSQSLVFKTTKLERANKELQTEFDKLNKLTLPPLRDDPPYQINSLKKDVKTSITKITNVLEVAIETYWSLEKDGKQSEELSIGWRKKIDSIREKFDPIGVNDRLYIKDMIRLRSLYLVSKWVDKFPVKVSCKDHYTCRDGCWLSIGLLMQVQERDWKKSIEWMILQKMMTIYDKGRVSYYNQENSPVSPMSSGYRNYYSQERGGIFTPSSKINTSNITCCESLISELAIPYWFPLKKTGTVVIIRRDIFKDYFIKEGEFGQGELIARCTAEVRLTTGKSVTVGDLVNWSMKRFISEALIRMNRDIPDDIIDHICGFLSKGLEEMDIYSRGN